MHRDHAATILGEPLTLIGHVQMMCLGVHKTIFDIAPDDTDGPTIRCSILRNPMLERKLVGALAHGEYLLRVDGRLVPDDAPRDGASRLIPAVFVVDDILSADGRAITPPPKH
jgi:hypothetical protein